MGGRGSCRAENGGPRATLHSKSCWNFVIIHALLDRTCGGLLNRRFMNCANSFTPTIQRLCKWYIHQISSVFCNYGVDNLLLCFDFSCWLTRHAHSADSKRLNCGTCKPCPGCEPNLLGCELGNFVQSLAADRCPACDFLPVRMVSYLHGIFFRSLARVHLKRIF